MTVLLNKRRSLVAELGPANALIYGLDRIFCKLGGRLRLFRYYFVEQPVADKAFLPPRRAANFTFREIAPGDACLTDMPLTAEKADERYAQGAVCYGVFKEEALQAYLWLCFGRYMEDEVRCCYVLFPEGQVAWDFDVYVFPEYRGGLAFARLWDGANEMMRSRGIKTSVSRVAAANLRSLGSHNRLGAEIFGSAIFFRIGSLEVMMSGMKPWLWLSLGRSSVPVLNLHAAVADTASG